MPTSARAILEAVQSGTLEVGDALATLDRLRYEDLGFAKVDHDRAERTGRTEVVYAPGKSLEHIREIVRHLHERGDGAVLVTRAGPEVHAAVCESVPEAVYHEVARIVVAGPERVVRKANWDESYVAVVAAGTADLPVAEEAAITLEHLGDRVERVVDVGVAGLHRLVSRLETLRNARALVVAAGMEGALPSVIAGLVNAPVVAVPTSIGYGASFGGLAALLAMLNSCASGISVVNIDNGFGAGVFASLVNR